jgi:hypothetical protein
MEWSPDAEGHSGWAGPNVDTNALRAWVERLQRDPNARQQFRGQPPFEFHLFGPGIELDEGEEALKGRLSIEINKQDDAPASIVVKHNDQTWEVTEETLDQLPMELQKPVKRFLGKDVGFGVFQVPRVPHMPAVPGIPEMTVPEMRLPSSIQQQFDEMNNRMEEMLKELQQLREDSADDEEDVDA